MNGQRVDLHWHREDHHEVQKALGQTVRHSAICTGHQSIFVGIWIGPRAMIEHCVNKFSPWTKPLKLKDRSAYGNEDLGNLRVEDHDLTGTVRPGMFSHLVSGPFELLRS